MKIFFGLFDDRFNIKKITNYNTTMKKENLKKGTKKHSSSKGSM